MIQVPSELPKLSAGSFLWTEFFLIFFFPLEAGFCIKSHILQVILFKSTNIKVSYILNLEKFH